MPAATGFFFFDFPFARDADRTIFEFDFHILFFHFGEFGFDGELLVAFFHIDKRRPLGSHESFLSDSRQKRAGEKVADAVLHRFKFPEGIPSDQCIHLLS